MSDNELPEIEPRLPENLFDRLEELHRRQEERGLTELEQAIVVHDLRRFNEAMLPVAEQLASVMSEVLGEFTEALQPLADRVSEEGVQ